jgi:hypothetical protein
VGLERPHVQHEGLPQAAHELERGLRGDEAAGRQEQQGARPGLRRRDLYRGRGPLPQGPQAELGIQDPYALDRKQFDAALALLRQQRKIVGRYWHDAFVQVDDFVNEGVVASSSWPFQVNLLRSKKAPVASVIPEEGATGWADTRCCTRAPSTRSCAYKWMEHSLSARTQGDLAAWFGSVPVVPDACKGNALLGEAGCETNGASNFDRHRVLAHPHRRLRRRPAVRPLSRVGHELHRGDRGDVDAGRPAPGRRRAASATSRPSGT